MDSIKRLVKKYLTKNNIRKISIFVVPLLLQFLCYKDFSIPFVLIGAYTPIIFNTKTKTERYYFILGLGMLIRFVAITIGILFLMFGKEYLHNIIIGGIFIILSLLSGSKMPYTLGGILLINSLAYFFLNVDYSQFATGFLIFILVEFLFGELELLAPFSKKKFSIDYKKLSLRESIMVVGTTLLIITTIGIVSIVEPFMESYARQQMLYDNKLKTRQAIEQENEKFIEGLKFFR